MKVIDAHAHIFPQKIAERAVSSIGSFYGIPMDDDGTADVLLREMRTANVSQSLVCSVATKPEQVTSINTFLAGEAKRHPEFVPFAAMGLSCIRIFRRFILMIRAPTLFIGWPKESFRFCSIRATIVMSGRVRTGWLV